MSKLAHSNQETMDQIERDARERDGEHARGGHTPPAELKLEDKERDVNIHFGWLPAPFHLRRTNPAKRPMIWLCNRHMDVSGEILGAGELDAIEEWCRDARRYLTSHATGGDND